MPRITRAGAIPSSAAVAATSDIARIRAELTRDTAHLLDQYQAQMDLRLQQLASTALTSEGFVAAERVAGIVRPEGLYGDGQRDDTTVLQDAINSCPAGSALMLPLPTNYFKVSSTLTIPVSGLRIVGGGPIRSWIHQSNPAADLFSTGSNRVSGLQFENLCLTGQGPGSANGIVLNSDQSYGTHHILRNVRFGGSGGTLGFDIGLKLSHCMAPSVVNCQFWQNGYGLQLLGASNGALIQGNEFAANWRGLLLKHATLFAILYPVVGADITANIFQSNSWESIKLENVNGNAIHNNYFEAGGAYLGAGESVYDIVVDDGLAGAGTVHYGNIIQGNSFRGSNSASPPYLGAVHIVNGSQHTLGRNVHTSNAHVLIDAAAVSTYVDLSATFNAVTVTDLSTTTVHGTPVAYEQSVGVFRPETYGAVGPAVDSVPAINLAIVAAAVAGGVVQFGPGTLKCSTAIALKSNVKLRGLGDETILAFDSALGVTPCIAGSGLTKVGVESLKITGSPAVVGSTIVYLNASTDVLTRALTISGDFERGIQTRACVGMLIEDNDVSGATEAGAAAGIWISGPANPAIVDQRTEVRGNRLHGNAAFYDICTDFATNNCGLTIHHNRCESTGVQIGIALFNGIDCSVHENECSGATCDVTHTTGGYGVCCYRAPTVGLVNRNNKIHGNHCHDLEGTGIYNHENIGGSVVGNIVHDVCSGELPSALQVAGITTDVGPFVVSGNQIARSGQAGISVEGADLVISGNTIVDTGTGDIALGGGAGIYLRGSAMANVAVVGNSLGNVAGGICTSLGGINNLTIEGNTVDGTIALLTAIQVDAASGAVISGNAVTASSGDGVLLRDSSGCIVAGNTIHDGSVGNTNTYRAVDLIDCHNVRVGGNLLYNTVPALQDGDMEAVGTAEWPRRLLTELITKEGAGSHGGAQWLKIVTADAYGGVYQAAIIPGVTYRLQGWACGDGAGAALPCVTEGGGTILWTGTNAAAWQAFDVTFKADYPRLDLHNVVGSGFVGFDDLALTNAAVYHQGVVDDADCDGIRIVGNSLLGLTHPYQLTSTAPDTTGNKFSLEPSSGTVALVAGHTTVATAEVVTGDVLAVTRMAPGGTLGHLSTANIADGSFDVNSDNVADTSTIRWEIVH